MENMEYWQFEFCGKDSSDIQGIGLREEIRETAVKLGINGTVKNEKKNGKVKAVCLVENTEKALDFFNKILGTANPLIQGKIDEQKSRKTKIIFEPPQIDHNFDGFQIEKEDELTEMVWALQGAGRVFEMQERARITRLDRALRYGLTIMSDCANELQTNSMSKRTFVFLAVDNYIKECPTTDQELIANLYDLHLFCEKANSSLEQRSTNSSTETEFKELLTKVLKLCSIIKEKLPKTKE